MTNKGLCIPRESSTPEAWLRHSQTEVGIRDRDGSAARPGASERPESRVGDTKAAISNGRRNFIQARGHYLIHHTFALHFWTIAHVIM